MLSIHVCASSVMACGYQTWRLAPSLNNGSARAHQFCLAARLAPTAVRNPLGWGRMIWLIATRLCSRRQGVCLCEESGARWYAMMLAMAVHRSSSMFAVVGWAGCTIPDVRDAIAHRAPKTWETVETVCVCVQTHTVTAI